MKPEDVRDILRLQTMCDEFDLEANREIAALLCEPERLNVYVKSRKFETIAK